MRLENFDNVMKIHCHTGRQSQLQAILGSNLQSHALDGE